jgi:hypothetical protein
MNLIKVVAKGQIWKEVDNRFTRFVKVVDIIADGKRVVLENLETKRRTMADIKRFNGKHGGYTPSKPPSEEKAVVRSPEELHLEELEKAYAKISEASTTYGVNHYASAIRQSMELTMKLMRDKATELKAKIEE